MKLWEALNASPVSTQLTDLRVRYLARGRKWKAEVTILGGAAGYATGPVRDYVIRSALEGAELMLRELPADELVSGVNPPGVSLTDQTAIVCHWKLTRPPRLGDTVSVTTEDGSLWDGTIEWVWGGMKKRRELGVRELKGFVRRQFQKDLVLFTWQGPL
jgi:hypothetical protein